MGVLFRSQEKSQERRQWTAEPPIPSFPGADIYGRPSVADQPDSALVMPTVWACVGLLANSVSMLPLETYRRNAGVPMRITDPQMLTNPSGDMTQSEWLHMLMVSLLLRGNAFGRISSRDGQQRPTQIDLLNPDAVTVDVDRDNGAIVYKLNGHRVPTSDIWHVRGMTLPGSRVGLSPIAYAATTIGVDLASRKFAKDFFEGGGIPKAVLTSDMEISQDTARTLKERLVAATRNREPITLGSGVKYEAISVRPEESQFLAAQQASVGQIAKFFNIPAGMVGGNEGNSMTYANVEQRSLDFLTYAVSFWLKRIEDAVFPLLPQPQYVRFNTEALLRTDAETQARVDVILLAGKIVAPSEIRTKRDLPPMTDAQKAEADLVPLSLTPNGGVKGLPALKELPGPVAPVPADEQQGAPSA